MYAQDNDSLPVWFILSAAYHHISINSQPFLVGIVSKKSKYRQARVSRKYKHGWEVPRDYAHALQLDIHNDNNKWKEAIDLEIEQIKEYQVFKYSGKAVYDKKHITNSPKGHQKIRVHFVFDVKHFGKFKG